MADSMEFFKKWTPIMPGASMSSDPFEVTPYRTVTIKAYAAGFVAPGPLALQPEGSPDLSNWEPLGAPINVAGAGQWGDGAVTNPPRFLRLTASTPGGQMVFFATGVGREN